MILVFGLRVGPPRTPPARILLGQELVQEYGAPTEKEVNRLFGGLTTGQLGLQRLDVTDECNRQLTVYPVELFGVPDRKLRGMRILRLSSKVRVEHAEHFLQPSTQIHASQGSSWLSYLASQMVSQRSEEKAGKKGLIAVKSFEDLEAKAMELRGELADQQLVFEGEQDEANKENDDGEQPVDLDPAAATADEQGGAAREQAFLEDATPMKKPRVEDPTAAMRRAAGEGRADAQPSNRKRTGGLGHFKTKADSKRTKVEAKETEEPEDPEAEGGDDANDETWESFEKRDKEMYDVAMKHYDLTGKFSGCFHFLGVGGFLQNKKLGQVLNGVL